MLEEAHGYWLAGHAIPRRKQGKARGDAKRKNVGWVKRSGPTKQLLAMALRNIRQNGPRPRGAFHFSALRTTLLRPTYWRALFGDLRNRN